MIQDVDDYPFHQSARTFSEPIVDDERWFDRYWFMTGALDPGLCLITGIGTYPNAKRIDAYAMLSDGKRQWNLRVGRERDLDPMQLNAHGLGFSIEEAMKTWRLAMDGYDELGFDLSWDERYPPNYLPPLFVERDGQVIMEMGHFAQGGGMSGTLRHGGETLLHARLRGDNTSMNDRIRSILDPIVFLIVMGRRADHKRTVKTHLDLLLHVGSRLVQIRARAAGGPPGFAVGTVVP